MKILKKDVLAETPDTKTTKIEVHAPLIATKAKPGQFVVLMVKEEGERIPLTIVKSNKNSGTIVLIFQELGLTEKAEEECKIAQELNPDYALSLDNLKVTDFNPSFDFIGIWRIKT